jgi:hypothetical protein
MAANRIPLNPLSVALVLGGTALVLVLASMAGQLTIYLTGHDHVFGLVRLSYVDNEQNVPTFFSALLLFCAALLLAVIARFQRRDGHLHAVYWSVLSGGFLVMAFDEAASFHELLSEPMRLLLGSGRLGIFHCPWVIPGFMIVLACGLFFLRFLRQLPAKTRLGLLTAAVLYVGGAIGVELLGNAYAEIHGRLNLAYSMIATVEESLEMSGAIVLIYTLLAHIAEAYHVVSFQLDLPVVPDAKANRTHDG